MLRPFSRFCVTIGAIPESIIKSMSYEEQLLRLIKFLKCVVIPAIDGNTEAIKQIENWISTLNIQEEVNNKLDEMAQSGQLAELITAYIELHSQICFNNVEEMKNAENLINGSFVRTYGYYNSNDGGSAIYKVRNRIEDDVEDEGSIIFLKNNLLAELIEEGEVNVLKWGVKNDGTPSYERITALFNHYSEGNVCLYFPTGTYLLNNTIYLPTKTQIKGDGGSTIIKWSSTERKYMFDIPITNRYCMIDDIVIDGNSIAYGIYDCDNEIATADSRGVRSKIFNLVMYNMVIGITINGTGSEFYNILCNGSYLYDDEDSIGFRIYGTDNFIHSCRVQRFSVGLNVSTANNRLVTVKSAVNDTGIKLNPGNSGFYNIDVQENRKDNLVMNNTNDATIIMNNQCAGYTDSYLSGEDLQYSLVVMRNCKNINISGSLSTRALLGNGSHGNEKYALNINNNCIGIVGNLIYENRRSEDTAFLEKPIFRLNDGVNNNIQINGERLPGNITYNTATITAVTKPSAVDTDTFENGRIVTTYKTSTPLNRSQNIGIIQFDEMNNPFTLEVESDSTINAITLQFYSLQSAKGYVPPVETIQQIVNTLPNGNSKLICNFEGLTSYLNTNRAFIEEQLEGTISRSAFIISVYPKERVVTTDMKVSNQ